MAKVIDPNPEYTITRTIGKAITYEKRGDRWKVRKYQKTTIKNPEFKQAYINAIESIQQEFSNLPAEEKEYWQTEAEKRYMEAWQLYQQETNSGLYQNEYGSNNYNRIRYQ